jgi:hypothetical protein
MTEYPLLVEFYAAIAVKIRANARTLRDRLMQSRQAPAEGMAARGPEYQKADIPAGLFRGSPCLPS